MKKIILSLLLCLFMSLCFAQNDNVLTEDLQEILNQKNNDLIDINILLKSQMPTEHLQSLNVKSDSKEVRREIVINELKKFSQQQQESVMAVIEAEAKNGNVTDINAHWLVNSINCKASRDVVYQLASHPDIKVMGLNKEDVVTEGYDEKDAASSRGTIASHVTHIQAEKVWDLGYTGKGVTVAVLDSGCNLDHVDIKDHLWTGNGNNGGYNFVNPEQRPMDNKGHGSHCAGIVCGDGTSGVSTGIAPDATLMVLKVNDTGGTEFDVMVEAIEYAVENGADIISISIGWWAPEASRKETFRSLFENALEANVVVAAAAGNNRESLATYPAPNNINSPADCPPPYLHEDQTLTGGVSAVISVGGVDEENNIIGVSSQGPVTWQNTTYGDYAYNPGMGLIRPDIVAQGASVKSLAHNSNTDHAIKAGTSMAAPAVAGVMALMLEKNPDLTPAELCRIIEETATPLSQTKSNDFGSGCINALAAVQAVSFNVQGAYLNKYNYTRNFNTGTNQNLELTLVNNGAAATSGATTVTLTSNDSNVTVANGSATISNTIAVNGTATCNFTINVSNLSPDNHVAKLTVTTSGGSNNSFEIELNISNELVAPSNITTQVQNLRDINLSWEATNNATSYNVYRDGSYIANTASTSYSDAGLEYGTLYTYTITSKRNELESESSREIRVLTGDNPETPSPTNVTVANNNTVSWTNSTDSKSSNVYRKESSSEEVQLASKIDGNSYTDNDWNSLPNGIYQYGVSNNHASEEEVYNEGFESSTLSEDESTNGWFIYTSGTNWITDWSVSDKSQFGNITPYMGEKAAFISSTANNNSYLSYLVTPQFDFTEYDGSKITLNFHYITPSWDGDINTLNVKISTTSNKGEWTQLWSSSKTDITGWPKVELDLSEYAGSTFYIAFENVIGSGYCTGLDEVSINVEGSKESRIEWSDNIYKGVNVFAQDGDMNNGDNWATNSTPSASDNVIIDANAVINGTVEVNSLTINEGASLTLNAGAKLIVNGDFVNTDADAFIINDGAQVIQNNEDVAATFNMNIVNPTEWSSNNKTGWQFIASPVKESSIFDFTDVTGDYDLYRYDGTKNLEWINHKDENDYEEPIIDTVTIGEGTISRIAAPIYNAGGTIIYSLSQQIYTNEEIGCDGGTIKSVAFHQAAGNNNMRDIVVYLQNVDKASYNGNYDWITFSDADIVYQGTFDFGKVGEWVTIELQNAFAYTGNNLVITVYDKTGTGFGYNYDICDKFYYSQIDEWRGMYVTSSAEMNLSSLSSSYGTKMMTSNWDTPQNVYYLNNIKLGIACIGSNETTAPDAPQNLVANAISSSAISLSWNSVKKATSYNIYEGGETVATNITETTYTVDGLTAETEYCFTVTAVNKVGESEKSEEACATTLKDIPAAPVVTATAISSSQIQLSWETVAGATWYNVYSSGYNFGPIAETNYTVENLYPNTQSCFEVSAANEAGESAKTAACATTLNAKPITPYDFTATATGESTIELSWSPANRATSYNVYQGDEKIATVTETTTYTVEGLEPETNYCFTVTAENEMGESDKTEEKCATTNEKAPTIVEIGTESDVTEYLPVYDYSAYSISQQIYTSSEIALGNGTIRSVSFKIGDKGSAATRQYEVYLKNITASSFFENGYEYFELSSSDKVYDGDVAVGGKQEWFTINFTTPFEYTGGNVVLCVYDKTGTALSNGYYHNFYKYAASDRSLYNKGYYAYDPTTLATSVSGTTTEPSVNLIRFGILPSEVVVPVAPTLSATATSSSEISLTWNSVPGATSYNVYKDDEQIAIGLTETTLNVEDLDAETEYCFTVTAVNEIGESAKSEACVMTEEAELPKCIVYFILTDQYTDGWNGNYLRISYDDGTPEEDLTLANGEQTKTFLKEISKGTAISVVYHKGSGYTYPTENSFVIKYESGEIIAEKAQGTLSGTTTIGTFTIDCTPSAPQAPVLTAKATGPTTVVLTWNLVFGAESYSVYKNGVIENTELRETTYIVEGLTALTEYCFTVTAVNEIGESEESNEECVTTKSEDSGDILEIQIGLESGLSTTYSPVYDYYKSYSVSQTIYTSNEIGVTSGTISSISYKNSSGNNNTRNIAVYLKNVDRNNFATKEWETLTSDLCVYDGSFTFGTNDWVTIELTNTFEYDGRNLLVCIVDKTGSSVYSSYDTFSVYEVSQTESESRAVYGEYKSYGTPINPLDLANTASTPTYVRMYLSGTYSYRAPLVKFEIEVNTSASRSATREVSSVSPSRGFNESTFQQGVGYLASYEKENTAVFKGNLNHEKSYVFPVSYNSEKDLANFHLLGNPFSFNMKWSNVTATNLASGYAVVNEEGGYTYLGAADDEIAVGDGFFVKAIGENPSISYNEGRSHRKVEDQSINVVITGNAGSDNVVVNLGKADEEGFPKLKNFNEEITTIFVYNNDKSYGIYNCEEEVEEVPIYFNNTNGMGKYTISINAKGDFENITLVDLVSGDETNMLVHDYNFTASQQENTKRFILKFVEKQQTTDNSNFVYQSGEELIVNTQGTVQIIDVVGRVVYNNVVLNESERINISGFTTGTYIVRVISDKDVMTQKIVVY